jgi:outer membrane protein
MRLHNVVTASVAAFVHLLFISPAHALDLKEAMERAKLYDTTFQAAYATYLATIEASDQSTAALLPQLDFNAFAQRGRTENDQSGNVTKSDNNATGYSLDLNQVIFNKTVFDNMDQGDAIAAKAVADLETAKQDVIVRTAQAYFDVLSAISTLDAASAQKEAIAKQLEQSTERFNVGLSAITDVKEQQASYDVAVADEIIAINDLSNKREALQVIINMYPEDLKVVAEDLPLVVPEPMDMSAWQKKALDNNFSLLAATYSVEAAQSAYEGTKGGHYPSLALNASYGVTDTDERDFSGVTTIPQTESTDARVVLNLNVPIYSGGLVSSQSRQKMSELNAAKALQEQQRRITNALARSSYLTVEANIAQVKARGKAVESTQTSLDATLAGYDAGTRTSVDVLLSQRQLYSSQRDYAVSRYTYLTNSLRLKQVAGILTIQDIEDINRWLVERKEPVGGFQEAAN